MTVEGEWCELPRQPYLTTVCHCDLCGKMIARRYFQQHHDDRRLRFCNEDCAKLWHEYWLPRYGRRPDAEVSPGGK